VTLIAVGRILLLAGLVLVVLGAGFLILDALGIHRVPGTFVWRRDGFTLIAPIGVMVAVSLLLTVLLNLLLRR
jgi:hypothetical protein